MPKDLTLQQFLDAFIKCDIKDPGIYHTIDGKWFAKVLHGRLTQPDRRDTYEDLQGLLSDLATVGIRTIAIEWDGLPSSGRIW